MIEAASRSSRSARAGRILPETVRLCETDRADPVLLRSAGAVESDGCWIVPSEGECDLAALSRWLPRSLGGTAGGVRCASAPVGHAADLASSLCPSSWRVLGEVICLRTGACVECGDEPGRSAAPSWLWNDEADDVEGRLLMLRALCQRCHPCERPEASSWRWPTAKRIARIAAISRMDEAAVTASLAAHSERVAGWEGRRLFLDLGVLTGLGLRFRKGWTHDEDVIEWEGGSATIVGATLSFSKGMVVIG